MGRRTRATEGRAERKHVTDKDRAERLMQDLLCPLYRRAERRRMILGLIRAVRRDERKKCPVPYYSQMSGIQMGAY
jgi:hypothetical protein